MTFAVQKGEVVGFLGPNGAGKSTTMRVIAGSLGASSGIFSWTPGVAEAGTYNLNFSVSREFAGGVASSFAFAGEVAGAA